MKKQIKMHLYHDHYDHVEAEKRSAVFAFWEFIFEVCYGVGLMLITVLLLPYTLLKTLLQIPSHIPQAVEYLKIPSHRKAVAGFVMIAIIVSSGVHGLSLIAAGQDLKGKVMGTSDAGIEYLQQAKQSLEAQDTASAQASLTKALEQFKSSEETLKSTGIALQGLMSVVPQKQDADRLLSAVQNITEAGIKATQLLELTNSMKLTAVGLSSGPTGKANLLKAQSLLNEITALAESAAEDISEVSVTTIPENYRSAFVAAQDASKLFLNNTSVLKEASSLLFDLLLGQKNVLIVFQNNNEIRASGGFMGTVGNAKLVDGSLTSLDIRTVYDWDGQLTERILPPQPLYAVNDRWFLRDSNWFADFSLSAGRIGSMFEKTGGETPDLIIAMTPEVILDMLKRTGPITLTAHGVTLDEKNFIEATQTATSVTYDKSLNQPKQFLADFYPLLMEKLGENGGSMAFLEVFQQNLYQKNILLYSRNADLQKKIDAFNWGGDIRETDRDYLSIVNSNLGGTKTDRFLERSTKLKTSFSTNGTVSNVLEYTVKNPLPKTAGLENKSFVRIYVPEGSELQSSDGFDNWQLPQLPFAEYSYDKEVQNWQKSVKQDTSTGVYTGTESGKTWFGSWLEVKGGETRTVTLSYILPYQLDDIDRHSLLIQKQPGSLNNKITYEVDFGSYRNLWKSNSATLDGSVLRYEQNLIADTFIGLVLEKL